ncbi:putative deacetylase LmbE-like domain [Pseudocohnilembus persalinus]|uniref:N-acetylglucosaminylphosphatidylinositol deacetylase n=1 Tax=Pseudocohnilembus persalinus TaxID=266149 RepID=A0A0V0QG81_PSEPJ|nr:putative deacetylase LmbE-like domain [Pseudocohnilembus persalinus]|eukprot:KRX01251.1 putative deacetylase LmbE-like domain [Pseudocohnilembus persalinus]
MNTLQDLVDFSGDLDFFTKYGLIISNFIIIGILLVKKQYFHQKLYNKSNDENKKNILFVTAHPDDEVMFFQPTIIDLQNQGYKLYLLCLSNGNFDGIGKIREKELEKVCKKMKLENFFIVNHSELQDGPNNCWKKEIIKQEVEKVVLQKDIKGIVTFDNYE